MKKLLWVVFVVLLAVGTGAQERKRNITSAEAERAVGEVAAFQGFPEKFRLARMGSVEAEGRHFHIFTTYLDETRRWRALVFANSGTYLGYYETADEPAELEKGGIVYPGGSYSIATGDEEEGVFDTGNAHIITFGPDGPPAEVKFEKRRFTFFSSPKRVQPENPGFRFVAVADRLVNAMNHGRYARARDEFGEQARARLDEEQTRLVFSNLRMRLGKVEHLEVPWIQDEETAVFPATFERGMLGLKMTLEENDKIAGLWVLPFETAFPDIGKNQTPLGLPFAGRWRVLWGGTTRETSKYFGNRGRHHALEFVVADRYGNTYLEEGRRNEDYFAFGRPVLAPSDGTVVAVVQGVPDNRPGAPNPFASLGNAVVIQHATNEVSVIGHLMDKSIVVKEGDVVTARQQVGRCGNSGDSTQPSIYYHLQDSPVPLGGSGYRARFAGVLVWKQGLAHASQEHVPSRGEYVEQHGVSSEERLPPRDGAEPEEPGN